MARSFNGSTQYCSYDSAVLTSYPYTMACWGKAANATANHTLLSITTRTVGSGGYQASGLVMAGADSGDPIWAWTYTSGGVNLAAKSTSGFSANTWTHCCAVFAAANDRRAYLNGANKGTLATSGSSATPDTTSIGILRYTNGATTDNQKDAPLNGEVAECGIWSVALDDAEILALSKGYSPLQIRPQSLVAYWPLGGHYGQLDLDRWKNRYDLTAYNSPTWAEHAPKVIYPRRSFWVSSPTEATAYTLTVDAATIELAGQSVGLSAARSLEVGNATISATGQTANVSVNYRLTVQPATINATGQTATISAQRNVTVGNATVQASGQAVLLSSARSVSVGTGEVQCAGQDAIVSAGRVCTVASGTAQVQGQSVGLSSARSVTVGNGAVALSGQAATVSVGRTVSVGNATVEVAGQGVLLQRAATLAISAAALQLNGQVVGLVWSGDTTVDVDWIGVSSSLGKVPRSSQHFRTARAQGVGRMATGTAGQHSPAAACTGRLGNGTAYQRPA